MADLLAIQQLLARYCWNHDSQNPEGVAACFTKDATFLGVTGRDKIAERMGKGYKSLTARRRHVLTNFIMLEDGETEAVVQSYITLYLIKGEELELHLIGVYRDHVQIEDGEWKISHRDATMDVPYQPGDRARAEAKDYPGK